MFAHVNFCYLASSRGLSLNSVLPAVLAAGLFSLVINSAHASATCTRGLDNAALAALGDALCIGFNETATENNARGTQGWTFTGNYPKDATLASGSITLTEPGGGVSDVLQMTVDQSSAARTRISLELLSDAAALPPAPRGTNSIAETNNFIPLGVMAGNQDNRFQNAAGAAVPRPPFSISVDSQATPEGGAGEPFSDIIRLGFPQDLAGGPDLTNPIRFVMSGQVPRMADVTSLVVMRRPDESRSDVLELRIRTPLGADLSNVQVFFASDLDTNALLPLPAADWISTITENGDFQAINFRDRNGNLVDLPFFVEALSDVPNVPEPTSLVLLGAGLAGLGFLRRRNRS